MTSIEKGHCRQQRKQLLFLLMLGQLLSRAPMTMGAAFVSPPTGTIDRLRRLNLDSRHLTQILTPDTLAENYLVTFSEDGEPQTLPLFVLELYATNGNLTDDALSVVEQALNSFLFAELDASYSKSGNSISAINTTVFSQLPKVLVHPKQRRASEKNVRGSQIQVLTNFTFTYQPSPVLSSVAETTKLIMQDLTYFVSNLSAFKDPELASVYLAIRSEAVTTPGTSDPPGITNISQQGNGTDATGTTTTSSRSSPSNLVVIPAVIGSAAVILALAAFLAFRRRRYRRRPSDSKLKDAPDLAYLDLESDFASNSYENSLPTSSRRSTPHSLMSPNGIDSTFDGLDAMSVGTGSPINASPRCKSLMSGLSNASATTIKISNVARSFRRNMSPMASSGGGSPTPKSTAASSLFAFLEDEANEDSSTESKPSLQPSDVSDDDDEQPQETDQLTGESSNPETRSKDLEVNVPTNNVSAPSDGPLFDFPPGWCSLSSPTAHVMDDHLATPEAVLADLQASQRQQNQQMSSTPGESSTRAIHGSALQKRHIRSGEVESPLSDICTPLRRNIRDSIADDYDRLPYWDTGSPPSRHLTSPVVASAAEIAVGRNHRDDEGSEGNGSTTEGTGESEGESLKKSSGAFPRWDNDTVGDDEQGDGATTGKSDSTRNRRRADYRGTGDGSDMYQMNAMHPLDWSNKSADGMSVGDSTLSDSEEGGVPRLFVMSPDNPSASRTKTTTSNNDGLISPSTKSPASYNSKSSRFSTLSESGHTKDSKRSEASSQSASRQLINDLVWLEKKIAGVRSMSAASTPAAPTTPQSFPGVINTDSLSYMSGDANVSPSSNEDEDGTGPSSPVVAMQSIICRDCYAPPGKLQIVIHSTKDGPAVHTVKAGSNLEGQVFPGDLIIAVDNIDTRSSTAEEVMKMMIAKSGFERKITVLHYDEE